MLTFLLTALGGLLACVAFVVLVAFVIAWLVGNFAERRATKATDRHADDATALTHPLPRRKAPTADALRTDARLREIEAELDAEYARLADFYLL